VSVSPLEKFLSRLSDVRASGKNHSARCPAHEDRRNSLSVGVGDDRCVLLNCFAGCTPGAIVAALGLKMGDLFPSKNGNRQHSKEYGCIAATYDYCDENGALLFQVVRYEPKSFRQRRPDGKGGWIWNLEGVRRVPYHLPELIAADRKRWVFVTEGEKDADALAKLGLVATCNPGGAGKWSNLSAELNPHLTGRPVVVLPDNDEAGRKHARDVAASLLESAKEIRIVELPGLPPKGDVSDWLAAGGTVDELKGLVREAKLVSAEDVRQWTDENAARAGTRDDLERETISEERASVGVRLSDVKPERVEWLWRARIPFGKPTILDGDPGLGKSTLTLEIAARVSRGEPLSGDDDRRAPAGVVILSAEDGLADTIRPRLEAAGADLERIVAIPSVPLIGDGEDLPEIPRDLPAVEKTVREIGARLVILDPLMAYLGADVSAHRDQDVRRALAPLARLADQTGAAVLVVRHLNKRSEGNPLYRGGGSIGIIGAARSGLLVAKDPDDEERRILAVTKSNLARMPEALAFRLEELGEAVSVRWEGTSPHTARTLLAVPEGDEERGALDEAREFLRELLSPGAVATREVAKEARSAGISDKTLRRAKEALGVRAVKDGFQGGWRWRLPSPSAPPRWPTSPEGGQAKRMGIFGEDGHLRESRPVEEAVPAGTPPDALRELLADAAELDVGFRLQAGVLVTEGELTDSLREKIDLHRPALVAWLGNGS
jgi:putative DNA primase/helicase